MADLFLELTEVTGESLDAKHRDAIEFHQLHWKIENSASVFLSSDLSQHPTVDHITIGKWVDNATPTLARMCAQGKHIAKGKITCRKNDGQRKVEYLTVELEGVKIDHVEWGGRGEETDGIQETVHLSFLRFTIKYIMQNDDGDEVVSGVNEFHYNIPDQKSQSGKPGK